MGLLASLAVVVGYVLGMVSAQPDSRMCCWPEQFEAILGVFGGLPVETVPELYNVVNKVSFDFKNQKWGLRIKSNYEVTYEYEESIWIEDYKTRTLYVAMATQGCIKVPLRVEGELTRPCIPPNARYVDGRYLSTGRGDEEIPYHVYTFNTTSGDKVENPYVNSHVIPGDCVTFQEQGWFTTSGQYMTVILGFNDFTMGLGDDNAFSEIEWYNCEERDEVPQQLDEWRTGFFRLWNRPEFLFLMNRIRSYD